MKRSTGEHEMATFVVRLWRNPSDAGEPSSWRGTAIHVQSGTERSIREIDGVLGFIKSWTQSAASDAEQLK